MPVYLNAKQVAERLQVSVSWVYKHKHLLGAVQVGERMWRFPENQLTSQLASAAPARTRRPRRAAAPAPAEREWRLT